MTMQQSREPILNADAGQLMAKAIGLTQTALASDTGKAVRAAIAKGPDGLLGQMTQSPQSSAPDPVTQASLVLAEHRRHFDVMRAAIIQMGQSLDHLNASQTGEPHRQSPTIALLNAQSEAIQGLTLLALKGQQMQTELINAVAAQSQRITAP